MEFEKVNKILQLSSLSVVGIFIAGLIIKTIMIAFTMFVKIPGIVTTIVLLACITGLITTYLD